MIGAVWTYALASASAGCVSALIVPHIAVFAATPEPMAALGRVVVTSLVFGALYLAAVVLLNRGWAPVSQIADLVRIVLGDRWSRSGVKSDSHSGAVHVAQA
jgi:hypothetical protein